ncbi:hypothetical protein SNE40_008379 [Patella caerulea]|uniref:Uncharacterized protein n=2 Tax=Patella caerulea TaxID=87958 RepID=A0AAN8K1R7_PATCE
MVKMKILLLLLCYCLVGLSRGQISITPVCTRYNVNLPSTVIGRNPLIADVVYLVSNNSVIPGSAATNPIPVNSDMITKSQVEYRINDTGSEPDVLVKKSIEVINSSPENPIVKISTVLIHESTSTKQYLDSVQFDDDLTAGLWAKLGDGFQPGVFEPNLTNYGRSKIQWNVAGNIISNDSRTLEYFATPSEDEYHDLPDGVSTYVTTVQFSDDAGVMYTPVKLEVCIDRTSQIKKSLLYMHGFTALSFFMAFILGILLVVLIVFIIVYFMKKRGYMATAVSPGKIDKRKMKETGKKIVLDAKDAIKKGFNTIKDYSLIGPDDSIVYILSLKDKLQMFREIDNLDILSTIYVDTDIEKEQNDATVQASTMLIQGMMQNGDISKQTHDQTINNLNNNMKDLERKLQEDYKKEMEIILVKLCARNREKVGEMLHRHNLQKIEVEEKTSELSEKETEDFLSLLEKQHQTEQNEMTYVLALEQNEEAEKLRKEFGIRKRLGIKEVQQKIISDVVKNGGLMQKQADWLIKEHKRQQDEIQKMYDEEISRQRMILEEKLTRRRGLAQASEYQEDDLSDMLNTMAGHQVNDINKLNKQGKISSELAEEFIADMKNDVLVVKEKMEKEKARQETELHKKLSLLKQEKMSAMRKRQEEEMVEYDKRCKEQQTEGPIDPVSVLEGELRLRSTHRAELSNVENELDSDHSKQLEKARDILAERTKDELYQMEKNLLDKLQDEGMKESEVQKILKQHEREIAELSESQEEGRRKQQEKLMEKLARRKKEWAQRKLSEKQEQEELREHESKVIGKLISSQMSISDEDRQKIMKEHEQHMVKLENNLTLNKLRQKRMLEERLALKRAQQMDKLQQKQMTEAHKQHQKFINNGEEDDEDSRRQEMMLMKKHAEQRLSVLNGQMLNIDEELEEIRIEMIRERALALKTQEERLGTMIARLQLEKAKELAKIEDQQKAINNLKINLVDDLNERGILSTPECEKLLERHKREKEDLSKKLDEQRSKQERSLSKRLRELHQLREDALIKQQETEMQSTTSLSGSKMAAKLKKMMLMHKQMIELERFRNQMEREMSQTLEDTRRQYQVQKMATLQKEEMNLIANMVKIGNLNKEELVDVLSLLFPHKTEAEKKDLLLQLYDDSSMSKITSSEHEKLLRSSGPSTLPERIRRTSILDVDRPPSRSVTRKAGENHGNKKKKKLGGKRASTYSLLDSLDPTTLENGSTLSSKRNSTRNNEDFSRGNYDNYNDYSNHSNHNDYHSNHDQPRTGYDNYGGDYDDEDDYRSRNVSNYKSTAPTGRLPPLEPIKSSPPRGKKKKKKLLTKMAHQNDYNDDYS